DGAGQRVHRVERTAPAALGRQRSDPAHPRRQTAVAALQVLPGGLHVEAAAVARHGQRLAWWTAQSSQPSIISMPPAGAGRVGQPARALPARLPENSSTPASSAPSATLPRARSAAGASAASATPWTRA